MLSSDNSLTTILTAICCMKIEREDSYVSRETIMEKIYRPIRFTSLDDLIFKTREGKSRKLSRQLQEWAPIIPLKLHRKAPDINSLTHVCRK